jgi:hypothetical protein
MLNNDTMSKNLQKRITFDDRKDKIYLLWLPPAISLRGSRLSNTPVDLRDNSSRCGNNSSSISELLAIYSSIFCMGQGKTKEGVHHFLLHWLLQRKSYKEGERNHVDYNKKLKLGCALNRDNPGKDSGYLLGYSTKRQHNCSKDCHYWVLQKWYLIALELWLKLIPSNKWKPHRHDWLKRPPLSRYSSDAEVLPL